jgi:hypothetical protein
LMDSFSNCKKEMDLICIKPAVIDFLLFA